MTHSEINGFLDCQLKMALNDGLLDALLAIRVTMPGYSLYDVLSAVLRRGVECYVADDIQCDISKYLKSSINPDLPW